MKISWDLCILIYASHGKFYKKLFTGQFYGPQKSEVNMTKDSFHKRFMSS